VCVVTQFDLSLLYPVLGVTLFVGFSFDFL